MLEYWSVNELISIGMYGIVNKSIEDLVKVNFGDDKGSCKTRSGVDVDFSSAACRMMMKSCFKLAQAVADEMNIALSDVFITLENGGN
jgi:hypothetical protein